MLAAALVSGNNGDTPAARNASRQSRHCIPGTAPAHNRISSWMTGGITRADDFIILEINIFQPFRFLGS